MYFLLFRLHFSAIGKDRLVRLGIIPNDSWHFWLPNTSELGDNTGVTLLLIAIDRSRVDICCVLSVVSSVGRPLAAPRLFMLEWPAAITHSLVRSRM